MLGVVVQQYCVVRRGLNVHRQVLKTDAKNARGLEREKARLFFATFLLSETRAQVKLSVAVCSRDDQCIQKLLSLTEHLF